MTATNKAFAYVFNTPSEDRKVARVLSSHDPEKAVPLLSLDAFDSETQVKTRSVVSALFTASFGLEMPQYNVNERALDTLMAYLLKHYPQLKKLGVDGPAVQRIEACTRGKGFSSNDLLAWSTYLAGDKSTNTIQAGAATQGTSTDFTKHPMYPHQASLIE
ncbi:hypothetical protein PC128_g17037 [Phytophthora cactorum]|nr:hypothetical protein PC128_g17037 [Phytophthora cactorum]